LLNFARADWLILALYCGVAAGIGYALNSRMKTGREFLEAGRSLPAWICGLAFLGAGLGAPEVIGLGACGARYGLESALLFSLGALPAMLFAGLFMMPLYYGSKARTVPEFLGMRFDGKTRTLNACLFAAMTVAGAGISMFAVARIVQALHLFDGLFYALGWGRDGIFTAAIVAPAIVVLVYVLLGGLRSVLYNRVLQFFLLVAGLLPPVFFGLRKLGGWSGLKASAALVDPGLTHAWMGITRGGMSMGLTGLGFGVVLGAGSWCADFRAIQAAMAAKDADAARRAPLIAAIAWIFLPFLLVLPGLVAIGLPTPHTATVETTIDGAILRTTTVVRPEVEVGTGLVPARVDPSGTPMRTAAGAPALDYAMGGPSLLQLLPTGLLGLGFAALLASLMSGLAASAAAFSAVFACDLYPLMARKETGQTPAAGRWAATAAILLSAATAYAAAGLNSIVAPLLLAFSIVTAPLFAIVLLGMFWRRATGHGAFAGLIAGAGAALLHHGLTLPIDAQAGIHGGWLAVPYRYPSGLAQSLWTATFAFSVALLAAVAVSLCTRARPEAELAGLVHGLTPQANRARQAWWKRPEALAAGILLIAIALNIYLAN
jgi:SSS family solute:Na+ symporter